jgi:acetoin utilization deacetylase AcuC-like enzyme
LDEGVGSNLAGGTHHAFPDRGEGFCVLNDVAVAIKVLFRDGLIRKAAIVDCDVHQGNGTATIFENEDSVFTLSIHGAKNYPLFKARSSLDIELPDSTGDQEYLETLAHSLLAVFEHKPEIIFYLAGADPYESDRLGRLALTKAGLRERDSYILSEAHRRGIPIATVMSGGYAFEISDTIEIHCNTIRSLKAVFYDDNPLSK